ncbi:MAG TPA: hypothetical protein VNN79_03695 [Actinomycetota bacterium]|nr:hypothetical protein [Actinomycetota bacterium]
MQRRSIGFVAALVAVAIATAACGGGGDKTGSTPGATSNGGGNALGGQLTHEQYQQKITQIAQDFQKQEQDSFGSLGNIQNPDDIAKLADQFNKAADDIDGVANELDGLNPPDDAAAANAKFVSGFHGIADELRQFAQAAAAKDLQKMQQLGTEFQNSQATKDLNAAEKALEKAGYTVPNSTSTS